jgi:hypothetical protein
MAILSNTGQAISFGRVYSAFTNASYPTAAGTGVRLSATLGANYGGRLAGTSISISNTFGGLISPFLYPP